MEYLSKIWLVTVFATPLFYWPVNLWINGDSFSNLSEFGPVLFATILGAAILSLPTFFILYFLLKKMYKVRRSAKSIKQSISIVGTAGIILTFLIVDASLFITFKGLMLPIIYLLIMICSSYIFKIDSGFEKANVD